MLKKYKTCLISDTLCDANGVSRFIQDMAKYGFGDGFFVLSSTKKQRCKPRANIVNIKPLLSIKMPFYKELDIVLPRYFRFQTFLSALKPDAIVISTPGPLGLVGMKIAKKMDVKIVAIYHTDFPSYIYKNTSSKWLQNLTIVYMRYFYSQCDLIFLRSNEYKQKLIDQLSINEAKFQTLTPGIDTKKFHPKHKSKKIWKEYGLSPKSKKLLYVGRLSSEKNFEFLLEVFREVKEEYGEVDLVCCGEGAFYSQKKRLKKEGVHLLGYKGKKELSAIYASSDIFLFPSTTDTLGQVVLEAQASGLCALVSDIGGPKTVVNDMQTGFVLPIVKELWSEKILTLLNDERVCSTMQYEATRTMQKRSFALTYSDFKKGVMGSS